MAFALTRPRFFAFFSDAVRVQSFGQKRRPNSRESYEAPSLVRVFNDFADDKWREDADCF